MSAVSPYERGYPVWTANAPHKKSSLAALISRLRKKSAAMELRFISEKETEYAAKLREGDEN